MKHDRRRKNRIQSPSLSNGFWAGFAGAGLIGLVGVFGEVTEQITALGIIVSSVMGLQLGQLGIVKKKHDQLAKILELTGLQTVLLEKPELLSMHVRIARSLSSLASSDNATLRNHAIASLSDLNAKISDMSEGKLVFENTETWRTVYERLLRKPEVTFYHSISWFRTDAYWQDIPGKQSLQLNCDLADEGLLIHRTVIVPPTLWAAGENLPRSPLQEWVEKQHVHGIWVKLVREIDIKDEPDLLIDLGIYGEVAIGRQVVDEKGQTSRFEVDYRRDERHLAEAIWERLNLFATSYAELLDREPKLP